ncbi:hypothetical protein TKK_0001101 [Trichogramma kaykai]
MQTSERFNGASSSGVWLVEETDTRLRSNTLSTTPTSMALLHDWLLLIPDYEGRPERLDTFCSAVRYVAGQLGSAYQRPLLFALSRKLRGGPLLTFRHRIHRYASVEEFLASLRAYFGSQGGESELLDQLKMARQTRRESVVEYAARIDRLATRLCSIYRQEEEDEKTSGSNEKAIWSIAAASFRRGLLKAEIEIGLAACELDTLEDAVKVALVIDREIRCRRKFYEHWTYKSRRSRERYKR